MTTYQPSAARTADAPLRLVLRVDAAACLASGVLLAAGGALLSPVLGLPTALLWPAGAFLLVFGALLWFTAGRATLSAAAVRAIVAVNAAWVLASAALVVPAGLFAPTAWGISFVLVQAAAVAALAVEEAVLLRRSTAVRR
ncbi:hypothetical protein CLV63_11618 [Murinocardiopsis flavida]|uniref:Integral membrane protein n=1 Tax=Murinocardiopsis flavida TaxID=645275 RepID=A0A2P8D8V3_9ACTN|nr:hypothetical protein [Murinocardiopsis flavida]PSK93611.1 hypothetical protein CLV63_11618 [Murinocardiopsis flavida]